jgi:hypothetical protein
MGPFSRGYSTCNLPSACPQIGYMNYVYQWNGSTFVSSHMTVRNICTCKVAALFVHVRAKLYRHEVLLCTQPGGFIAEDSPQWLVRTRDVFSTDILPHKMHNIIIDTRAIFAVTGITFWWYQVHSTGTIGWRYLPDSYLFESEGLYNSTESPLVAVEYQLHVYMYASWLYFLSVYWSGIHVVLLHKFVQSVLMHSCGYSIGTPSLQIRKVAIAIATHGGLHNNE